MINSETKTSYHRNKLKTSSSKPDKEKKTKKPQRKALIKNHKTGR